jgi:hypothetical protein
LFNRHSNSGGGIRRRVGGIIGAGMFALGSSLGFSGCGSNQRPTGINFIDNFNGDLTTNKDTPSPKQKAQIKVDNAKEKEKTAEDNSYYPASSDFPIKLENGNIDVGNVIYTTKEFNQYKADGNVNFQGTPGPKRKVVSVFK